MWNKIKNIVNKSWWQSYDKKSLSDKISGTFMNKKRISI